MDNWSSLRGSKILQSTIMKLWWHLRSTMSQKKRQIQSHPNRNFDITQPPAYVAIGLPALPATVYLDSSSELCDWCLLAPLKQSSAPVILRYISLMSSHSASKWLVASYERDTNICRRHRTQMKATQLTWFVFFSSENILTWLFFPSSLGTNRFRTETNLDLIENNTNEILFQIFFRCEASPTFAWWAPEAPALAGPPSRDCWFLLSCSPWRCKLRLPPRCERTTPQICRCLHGWGVKVQISFVVIMISRNNFFFF